MQVLTPGDIERGLKRLPALSTTVTQVLGLTQQQDVDIGKVSRVLAQDPGLTARILRLANSPFFGLAGQVTSIRQACVVLGNNAVRNLAAAIGIRDCFSMGEASRLGPLWRQAMERAIAAQALAQRCHRDGETAFTAGMLHDLGTMVMACCFSDALQQVEAWQGLHHGTRQQAEQAVFGIDHRLLGLRVAQQWALPAVIRQAIAGPDDTQETAPDPIVDIVQLAAALSTAPLPGEDPLQALPGASVHRLGLDATALRTWLADVEAKRALAELLA